MNESFASATSDKAYTWDAKNIIISILLFVVAGLFEIGGGYLVWKGVRANKSPIYIVFGSLALIAYGFIPTLQMSDSFGRTFAAYGGFFIVLSYAWAIGFDNMKVDIGDIAGASISVAGVCLLWFWPRN